MQSVASTRVQSWGDEAPKGVGFPSPTGGGAFFCFVISKWHILVNSEVLNLKFFFIVSSLGGVWVDSDDFRDKRHY